MRFNSALKKRLTSPHRRDTTGLAFFLLATLISTCLATSSPATTTRSQDDARAVELEAQRQEDSKLIDGLRRRRLFDLAQLHCQQQLMKSDIDPTTESHLTIELMKTRTAKAILTAVSERPAAWKSVDETATKFSADAPNHPRRLLIEVQRALSHLTHARMIRQEIAAEMANDSARQQALDEIRTGRSLLERLGVDIDKAIPELRGRSKTEHDLTVKQLLNLKNNVRFQLATCNLIRSQLYEPKDRLNRVAALGEVKQQLGEVQRVTKKGQPLWWNAQLGQLQCLRLLGDSSAAKLLVDSLPTKEIPPATIRSLLEEKIRLATEMGNESFSKQVFEEYQKLLVSHPQLDIALVELAADLSARATSDDLKKQWLDYASGFARKIESDHGGYWGRRADLILIRAAGGNFTPPDNPNTAATTDKVSPAMGKTEPVANTELDQLIRLAENSFRKNNLDDAIRAYRQASAKARSLGDSNQALQLGMIVGQIFEKQSKPDEAAQQFINSALADVDATSASTAHLRGCWNIASNLKDKTKDESSTTLAKYRAELDQHLKLWSDQPSADLARIYLADRNLRDRQWKPAFENYLGVRPGSTHLAAAINGLGVTTKQILAQSKRDQQSTISLSAELVSALVKKQSQLTSGSNSAVQLDLLISELDLVHGSGASDQTIADTIARRIESLENSTELSVARSSLAIRAAATSNSDLESATALVGRLGDNRNSLELCQRCLEAIVSRRGAEKTLAANRLRLVVIDNLLGDLPSPDQAPTSTKWLLKKASVLSALSRHDEAVIVLDKLSERFPKNAGVQMQLARSMTAQNRISNPEKPLNHWRRLLRKLKSHSPDWYEAKYNVAMLLHETGKSAEAVKLLKLLRDVSPGWDDSQFKSRFESLLISAEGSN